MSRPSPELLKARIAISMTSPEEFAAFIAGDRPVQNLIREFRAVTDGRYCARCFHFSPLGQKGSGTCGTCAVVPRSDYTKPEDTCELFKSALEGAEQTHGENPNNES